MMISSVKYYYSSSDGSKATLELVDDDSFSLIVNKKPKKSKTQDQGVNPFIKSTGSTS
jgi:hypothetical protein